MYIEFNIKLKDVIIMVSDNQLFTQVFDESTRTASSDGSNEVTRFFDSPSQISTPKILVSVKSGEPSEAELTDKKPVTIGRKGNSSDFSIPDIIVHDVSVSRGYHMVVTKNNNNIELWAKEGKSGFSINNQKYQMNHRITNIPLPIDFYIGENDSVSCSIKIKEKEDPEKTRINFNFNSDNIPFPSNSDRQPSNIQKTPETYNNHVTNNNQTTNRNFQNLNQQRAFDSSYHDTHKEKNTDNKRDQNFLSQIPEHSVSNASIGNPIYDNSDFGPNISNKTPTKSNINFVLLIVVLMLILMLLGLTLYLVWPKYQNEFSQLNNKYSETYCDQKESSDYQFADDRNCIEISMNQINYTMDMIDINQSVLLMYRKNKNFIEIA